MSNETKDAPGMTNVEFVGSFPMDIPDNRGKIYAVVCFTTEDYMLSGHADDEKQPGPGKFTKRKYQVKPDAVLPDGHIIVEEGTKMGRSRTWGWYSKREDAERAIANNATDMCELGYYSHALVEEVLEGICAETQVLSWWKFVGEQKPEDRFPAFHGETMEAPGWAKNTCGFSMG